MAASIAAIVFSGATLDAPRWAVSSTLIGTFDDVSSAAVASAAPIEAAPKLARMSSTTFDAQLDVAGAVAEESPELYYEIQALNDYGAESLQALASAGGLTQRGTARGLRVSRKDAGGTVREIEPTMTDTLRPDDVVFVRESVF